VAAAAINTIRFNNFARAAGARGLEEATYLGLQLDREPLVVVALQAMPSMEHRQQAGIMMAVVAF